MKSLTTMLICHLDSKQIFRESMTMLFQQDIIFVFYIFNHVKITIFDKTDINNK